MVTYENSIFEFSNFPNFSEGININTYKIMVQNLYKSLVFGLHYVLIFVKYWGMAEIIADFVKQEITQKILCQDFLTQ